jgi:hypothetical protein
VRLDGGTWPKCFSAETLVLTDDGLIPISAVQIGQRVLTHKNRWRRVLSSGQTGESETVTVAGTGGTLNCTSDHPFLSCDLYKPASSKEGRTKLGSASWVRADELVGKAWAIPVKIESLPLILPDGWTIHDLPNNFWWVIGRWIGDGWAESYSSRVTICCGIHERDQLKNELNDTGWLWRESGGSIHAPKFRFSNPALHSWLRKYFGTSAKTKKIPAWILGANYRIRDQILKGYMSADGEFSNRDNNRNGRLSAHTISRELAIGVKLLAATLGWSSRVYKHKAANPSTCRGRTITPRNDAYLINWSTGRPDTPYSQSWAADGQLWTRVRSVRLNEQIVPVYNLEVEEDNSFIANGFIVHNCNDLSKADTEVGTWSVRASYGRPVPVLGQIAMGDLACQFIKAIAGEDCELPRNIASLARQGMVINFANASTLMREGRTGIYTVDMFLNAVNPHGLRQRARTFSVDKDSRHRTVY